MADENTSTTTETTTTTPAAETQPSTGAQPTGERTFTQADLDRIVNERLARDRQRRAEPARTTNAQTQAPQQTTQPQQTASSVTYDADAFNDALSEFPFDKEQRATVRDAARRENPSDVDAFVAKWGRMFGKQPGQTSAVATTTTTQAAATTTAPKTAPQGAPVTAGGAPANPTTVVTDDTPILRMSESDRVALMNRIGRDKYVDRMRQEFRTSNVRVRFNKG